MRTGDPEESYLRMKNKYVVLDSCILGMITHPSQHPDVKKWLNAIRGKGCVVYIPEISDYELRRELLRLNKSGSLIRLNTLKLELEYLPIFTDVMIRAAEFWAMARKKGIPTSDPKSLDIDVILAAQADTLHTITGVETIVATTNVKHLQRFVKAERWNNISM